MEKRLRVPGKSSLLCSDDSARLGAACVKGHRRVTLILSVEQLEQLRNAVYWTPGMTLAGLIKAAVHESLERLEQRNGCRYPARLAELKCGRPRKVRNGTRIPFSVPPPDAFGNGGFRREKSPANHTDRPWQQPEEG